MLAKHLFGRFLGYFQAPLHTLFIDGSPLMVEEILSKPYLEQSLFILSV